MWFLKREGVYFENTCNSGRLMIMGQNPTIMGQRLRISGQRLMVMGHSIFGRVLSQH